MSAASTRSEIPVNGQEGFAWTQNNGHLLAVVVGPVHEDAWNWWLNIHHNIGLAGTPMNMRPPGYRTPGGASGEGLRITPGVRGGRHVIRVPASAGTLCPQAGV